jgi:hypothetical protein
MALSIEQTRYYEDILETLNSPGWKHLLVDFEEHKAIFSNILHCPDEKALNFMKGRLERVDYLLSLREMFELAYETVKAEAEAQAEEGDTE